MISSRSRPWRTSGDSRRGSAVRAWRCDDRVARVPRARVAPRRTRPLALVGRRDARGNRSRTKPAPARPGRPCDLRARRRPSDPELPRPHRPGRDPGGPEGDRGGKRRLGAAARAPCADRTCRNPRRRRAPVRGMGRPRCRSTSAARRCLPASARRRRHLGRAPVDLALGTLARRPRGRPADRRNAQPPRPRAGVRLRARARAVRGGDPVLGRGMGPDLGHLAGPPRTSDGGDLRAHRRDDRRRRIGISTSPRAGPTTCATSSSTSSAIATSRCLETSRSAIRARTSRCRLASEPRWTPTR